MLYLGYTAHGAHLFTSPTAPSPASHPQYLAVDGPFRSILGAELRRDHPARYATADAADAAAWLYLTSQLLASSILAMDGAEPVL